MPPAGRCALTEFVYMANMIGKTLKQAWIDFKNAKDPTNDEG